jgi:hypothetical protein
VTRKVCAVSACVEGAQVTVHQGLTAALFTRTSGGQAGRRDGAEPAGLVVLDRLEDLGAGVHDERSVVHDRGPDRQPTEEKDIEGFGLAAGGRHHNTITGAEHGELVALSPAPTVAQRNRSDKSRVRVAAHA